MIPPIEQPLTKSIDSGVAGGTAGASRDAGAPFSILQTIMMIGGIQIGAMAFGLLQSKIVAVTIGPRGVGVISVVDQLVGLVAQISTFSLPYAAVKFLSAAHSDSRDAFVSGFVVFVRALWVISLIGTGIAMALVWGWPRSLGPDMSRYRGIVIVGLLAVPATNLTALMSSTMAAARRTRAAAVFGLVTAVTLLVMAGGGILFAGLYGYYVGDLVATIALLIGAIAYLIRCERLPIHDGRVGLVREIRRYPHALSYAGALYVTSFTSPLAYLIARYLLLRSGGFAATGLLQASMGLGLGLIVAMRAANQLFLTPAVNRTGAGHGKFVGAVEFLRGLSVTIGIVALPIVLFPHRWLALLYSREFVGAAPFVYLFVLAAALQLLSGVNMALIIGLDRIGTQVSISVAGELGMAAIAWWLIPSHGIGGAAAACLFNPMLVFVLSAWHLRSRHGFAVYRAMGWLPATVLMIIAVGGAFSASSVVDTPSGLLLKMALWTLLAAVGIRYMRSQAVPSPHKIRRSVSL